MKSASLLSILFSAAIGLVAAEEELKIEVTHAVECSRKTQKGASVSMHYRGTLADSGKKFDASMNAKPPYHRFHIRFPGDRQLMRQ